jgi:MATE family multidrug resistance protein
MSKLSYSRILKLAIPVTVAQLMIFSCTIVDMVFIRDFGHDVIASMGVTNTVYNTIISFAEGFVAGTAVLIARYYSKQDLKRCSNITLCVIALALLSGLVFYIIEPYLSAYVFSTVNHGNLMPYGMGYMSFWIKSLIAVFFLFVCEGIFRGIEDTVSPLISIMVVGILNIFLDYALIYGKYGSPAYGYVGAAMASCYSYYIGALIILALMLFKKETRNILSGINLSVTLKESQELLSTIWDIGFYTGFMVAALIINNYIIGYISTEALAINQVVFQLFLFFYLTAIGFMASTSVLVSSYASKNDIEAVRIIVRKTLHISVIIAGIVSLILLLKSKVLAQFFLGESTEVLADAVSCINIIAIAQLNTSIYMVLRGALTGYEDTKFVAYLGLSTSYIFFLPFSYLLAIYLKLGIIGNYYAFLIWTISDVLLFAVRCHYKGILNINFLTNGRGKTHVRSF